MVGIVYLEFRHSKKHLLFIGSFIIRRYVVVELIFDTSMSQGIKLIIIFYLNLFCFVLVSTSNPYISQCRNKTEMINEFMISILSFEQVAFTDFVGIREAQEG